MKQPIKMVIVTVMHYFHSMLEHGLPPSLNLNHNTTYSTLPRIHVHIQLSECTIRVAEHVCDDASKRILKPSTYRLQIFLVRDKYLRSSLPQREQATAGQLEKHVLKPMVAILTTYMETRLNTFSEYSVSAVQL